MSTKKEHNRQSGKGLGSMSEQSPVEAQEHPKKLLENPLIGSLVVPIAIVLVGALVIFGVTKMLSTERSYKDLVREMHSKTFGNRWIAAYELSKQISSSQIPENDIPWLITNLSEIYTDAADARTRDFIVVALGALQSEMTLPIFSLALKDQDKNVRFHALVALGNMSKEFNFDWNLVMPFLSSDDNGEKQVAVLALASHEVKEAAPALVGLLNDVNPSVRYAAATGLINYKSSEAVPVIKEILLLDSMPPQTGTFNADQVMGLKMNVLDALLRKKWNAVNQVIESLAQNDKNPKVLVRARDVLIKLKN